MSQHLDDSPEGLARFLAADPSRNERDFKGKGFDTFRPFDRLAADSSAAPFHRLPPEEVRRLATSEHARFLPRNVRQAAGRDPGLVWVEEARTYRRRADSALHHSGTGGG